MKRALDFVLAAIALVITAPVVLAAALAAAVVTRGNPIFRQERVGRDFRPFDIFKLKTMRDAEGSSVTAGGDPRLTRVGSVLRTTKIDELPQLLNVLKGDMSLVGPRPEVPRYVDLFRDDYVEILKVRPGMTDWASIKYRNESEVLASAADPERTYVDEVLPDKIEIALRYVAERSMAGDLKIVLATIRTLVRARPDTVPRRGS